MEKRELRRTQERLTEEIDAVSIGAVWAAFIDFRGEVRDHFSTINEKLDKTNGRLREHDLRLAAYAGGLFVLGAEFTVFGGVILAKLLS